MLQDKMLLDPAISMVLFNEYIPLQRREPKLLAADRKLDTLSKAVQSLHVDRTAPEKPIDSAEAPVKAEPAQPAASTGNQGGLFLRSAPSEALEDDWVIA